MSKTAKKAAVLAKKSKKKKKTELKRVEVQRSSWQLLRDSILIIKNNYKLLGGISLIYAILLYIFVFSDAGLNIADAKNYISETLGNEGNNVSSSITIYGYLLDNTAISNNPVLPLYQTVLGIIFSLVFIWSQREITEDQPKAKIKDAFYNSTNQLIPFVLILFIVALQFIPAAIGSSIYSNTILQGFISNPIEMAVLGMVILSLIFFSFFLLVPSVPAVYIVTLDGATPWDSYKASRKLVKGQRFGIMRKMIFVASVLLILSAVLVVPLIAFLPVFAEIVFLLFTVFAMLVAHTYFYQLYRDLI